jgi:hypothetical protein
MEILSLSMALGDCIPFFSFLILFGGKVKGVQESSDTNAKDQDHHEYGFKRHLRPPLYLNAREVSW